MKNKYVYFIATTLIVCTNVFSQNNIDTKYNTVKIGGQIWMVNNLDVKTKNSHYYQFDSIHNHKYGLLYNWHEANSICPAGWHLPSKKELGDLLNYYDNKYDKFISNDGFNGKLGGYGYYNGDEFGNIALQGYYWSATTINENGAWCFKLENKSKLVELVDFPQNMEFSVKCIKNKQK